MHPLDVFIHVSCINHWQEILTEQVQCLATNELDCTLHIYLNGVTDNGNQLFPKQLAKAYGFISHIHLGDKDTSQCETPTIQALENFAHLRPNMPVLYMHGKGVAHPNSLFRTYWRWHMQHYLVRRLREALTHLQKHPWVAASARNVNDPLPHAAGNYFLATTNHLCSLPYFRHFRASIWPTHARQHPHLSLRHADEMWLGANEAHGYPMAPEPHKPWHHNWYLSHPQIIRNLIAQH